MSADRSIIRWALAGEADGTWSWAGLRRLVDDLTAFASTEEMRCLVLQAGGADFCTGMTDPTPGEAEITTARELLVQLEEMRVPVMTVLSGRCIGLGLEVALATDVIVAAPTTQLGLGHPQDRSGAAILRHSRWHRNHLLAELSHMGTTIDAARAHTAGLVDVVTDDPAGEAARLAIRLAGAAPRSMELARHLLHRDARADLQTLPALSRTLHGAGTRDGLPNG